MEAAYEGTLVGDPLFAQTFRYLFKSKENVVENTWAGVIFRFGGRAGSVLIVGYVHKVRKYAARKGLSPITEKPAAFRREQVLKTYIVAAKFKQ